jgi:diguanylate cyclase (GGDEF)-like protein
MRIGISKKLIGSFTLGVVIYALSIGAAYIVISDLVDTINSVKALSKMVNLTGDLRLYLNKLLIPVSEYLAEGDPAERDHYDERIMQISETLDELRQYKGGDEWREVLRDVSNDITVLGGMVVEVLYIENPVGNKKAVELMKGIHRFSDQVIGGAERFHEITLKEMEGMERLAKAKERNAKTIFAVVIATASLSLPLLSLYLSRYVTRPILTLHKGVQAIGSGALGHRVTVKTGDELEALAGGFNDMAASLEEAKKELDRRILELFTLYNVSKVLNTTFETEQLLLKLVTDISKNLDIHRVMIMLIDERTQELYTASFTDFEKEGLKEVRRKVGEGLYGLIAQTGMGRLIKDVDTELNLPKEDILSPDIRSIIAVPFGRRNKVLGLLCAFKDRPGMFEWHDLELFRAVAEHVAIALENARLYHETKMQAITDGLTGLYNHRFFREHLEVEVERTERYGHKLSLIILDIDHFKHYNDTHGHPQGDEILRDMAKLLRKNVRESDFACRYGGEEFSLILPETSKEAALSLAERIREAIRQHPFPHRETQPMGAITVSIGVSAFPDDCKDMERLIKKADDALYRAKAEGRNRVAAA